MLLAIALALAEVAPPTLSSLTEEAAPIAIVRVEKIKAVEQMYGRMPASVWPEKEIRVAQCAVERTFLGDPQATQIYLVLRVPSGEGYDLAVGERVLVFGNWCVSNDFGCSRATRENLDRIAHGQGVVVPLHSGVWRVQRRGEADIVEPPDGLCMLPKDMPYHFGWVPLAALRDWLAIEVERVTPTIEAYEVTTAPCPYHVRVRSDGSWIARAGLGTKSGTIERERWEKLRQQVNAQAMPGAVLRLGSRESKGPCGSWSELRIRRLDGVWEIATHAPEDASAELRAALTHAKGVWDTLLAEVWPPQPK